MACALYRGRDGKPRLWFEPKDIERMMEDELRKAQLFPTEERSIVDLERFIDRHLGVHLDQYAELEPNVLGQTEFFRGARPRILINRDLTGAAMDDDQGPPALLGRWRATLAHEASHVLMHRILFEPDAEEQAYLFAFKDGLPPGRLMRCLKTAVVFRDGGSDWREVQANRGMAALLMPSPTFRLVATSIITRLGLGANNLVRGSTSTSNLTAEIATAVAVSRRAAGIRLETLGIVSAAGQANLEGVG